MDWNRMEGNWKRFKGRAKEKWGRLTDDDLNVINGRQDELEGKVQEPTVWPRTKPKRMSRLGSGHSRRQRDTRLSYAAPQSDWRDLSGSETVGSHQEGRRQEPASTRIRGAAYGARRGCLMSDTLWPSNFVIAEDCERLAAHARRAAGEEG